MSNEDQSLDNYAVMMELQLKSRQVDVTPTAAIECDECGDAIPKARKAAAPWAIRCIDCETEHARRIKHKGGK